MASRDYTDLPDGGPRSKGQTFKTSKGHSRCIISEVLLKLEVMMRIVTGQPRDVLIIHKGLHVYFGIVQFTYKNILSERLDCDP